MDEAIAKIRRYIKEQLVLPSCSVRSRYFVEQSYARWAAYEILDGILEESERLPSYLTDRTPTTAADIAEMFRDKMDYYIYLYGCKPEDSIFYTARETANRILQLVQ